MQTEMVALRAAREQKKLTRARLAELSGISASHIHHLEIGLKKNPTYKTVKALSESLDVHPSFFFDANNAIAINNPAPESINESRAAEILEAQP